MPPTKPTKPNKLPPLPEPPAGFTKKHMKRFLIRIYGTTAIYAGDVELLDEIIVSFPHVNSFNAYRALRDLINDIGQQGYHNQVEKDTWVFYPVHRIHYVEYIEV
jgi:hypothetical protein